MNLGRYFRQSVAIELDDTISLRWLNGAFVFFMVAVLSVVAVVQLTQIPASDRVVIYSVSLALSGAATVAYMLLRRGLAEVAGIVLTVATLLVVTGVSFILAGIRDGTVVGYFVVLVLANLFLRQRAADLIAILCVAGLVTLYIGEQQGIIVADVPPQPDIGDLLVRAVSLIVCAILLRVIVLRLVESHQRVNETNAELAAVVTQLETSQAELRIARDELAQRYARSETELASTHAALLNEMRERESIESALVQAQRFQSLGILAGGAAHDLRNRLNIMGLYAELVRNSVKDSPKATERVDIILKSVRHAADLTTQILTIAGNHGANREVVDVNQVVGESIAFFNEALPTKITLTQNLAPGLAPISADRTQLQQVLSNLIMNGQEAIGPESGTLHLRTYASEDCTDVKDWSYISGGLPQTDHVRIEVSDTGCGMDRRTVAKVFDPLFTTKPTGVGLGLAATMRIIESHGGAIGIRTAPGKGSTFTLFFPVAEALGDVTE